MKYRKENKRAQISQKRILILCEGRTERLYLEGLKKTLDRKVQREVNIEVTQARESEPKKAIKEILRKDKKAKKDDLKYSNKWLVFDDDNRDLDGIFNEMIGLGINYAYNSISIEFWFLLHFKNTSRQFDSANIAIRQLKNHISNYSKTDHQLWSKLESEYDTAKIRAITIRKQHKRDGNIFPNCKPFTNMDELIDMMKNLANS